jgi:hypothetical protein
VRSLKASPLTAPGEPLFSLWSIIFSNEQEDWAALRPELKIQVFVAMDCTDPQTESARRETMLNYICANHKGRCLYGRQVGEALLPRPQQKYIPLTQATFLALDPVAPFVAHLDFRFEVMNPTSKFRRRPTP